jgi:hypothetical protein
MSSPPTEDMFIDLIPYINQFLLFAGTQTGQSQLLFFDYLSLSHIPIPGQT